MFIIHVGARHARQTAMHKKLRRVGGQKGRMRKIVYLLSRLPSFRFVDNPTEKHL